MSKHSLAKWAEMPGQPQLQAAPAEHPMGSQ